ncbi:PHP domain-containing protein [Crassaminicella thermophila]|uniref:PHP domain-containing protein n=1 Tax=Crassaminicella thermophila TaxID=2599308 RepID=A0A5C0SH72_CRATE|nr:PHP domain-containing protein [Crassaminicella thermophila]QEK12319.1 PHP domain-containing protein [Crassaminicella thermophila]
MKIAIDFHIHTALSPCADEDMTPNNIVNMSVLKGLDAIAITDHNSVENCKACMQVAQNKDIIIIPGIELQTKEEVHLICLFKDIESAIIFQKLVYNKLPNKENIPEIFGRQLLFDAQDRIISENNKMLIASVNITLNEVFYEINKLNGIVIPAHIDRSSYSLIGNLGFIPNELQIRTLEVSKNCNINKFLEKHKNLNKYQIIQSSDAHYLWDILERESYIEVATKNIDSIFEALK